MEPIVFNKCQTPFEDLELQKYPNEVCSKEYSVYRHINPKNRKVYVGITKMSLLERWNKGYGYKNCTVFHRAIKKYGWDNFQHCVVCSNLDRETACLLEQHLIKYYKAKGLSYNMADGGIGTKGCHMPEEAKRKISKFVSEYHKKPVLQYTISGKFVKEYKSAQDASRELGFGRTSVSNCASDLEGENTLHGYIFIYKDKIDTLPERLKLCKDHWRKYKIVQYKDGNIINTFDSIREAERATGVNRVCIRKNINGDFRRAGKYTWKKIKEEDLYGNVV